MSVDLLDIGEAEYRAMPGVSGTAIGDLLTSPMLYAYKLANPTPPTPAMALGTLFHALTLGQPHPFIVSEFDDFRTKAAREWKALQAAEGREIVTADVWATAEAMRDAVMSHKDAAELLALPGTSEASLAWDEDGTPCKGRVDRLTDASAVIDLKSARSLDGFNKSIGEYAYHAQLMHYRRGAMAARGEHVAPRPLMIAVENTAPHRVQVIQLSVTDANQGEAMCVEAYRRWADCTAAGVWPSGLPDGVTQSDIPAWSARQWDAHLTQADFEGEVI